MKKVVKKVIIIVFLMIFSSLLIACDNIRITGFMLEINGQPYNKITNNSITIMQGENITADNFIVIIKKSDNSTSVASLSTNNGLDGGYVLTFNNYDNSTVGIYLVTLSYKNFNSIDITIEVVAEN